MTIEHSWAWSHGYLPGTGTAIPAGNGNGFKIGGFSGLWEADAPVHVTRFNVAIANKVNGFYANHHPVANQFYNNTAANNGIEIVVVVAQADIEAGKWSYSFRCAQCHGDDGDAIRYSDVLPIAGIQNAAVGVR